MVSLRTFRKASKTVRFIGTIVYNTCMSLILLHALFSASKILTSNHNFLIQIAGSSSTENSVPEKCTDQDKYANKHPLTPTQAPISHSKSTSV